MTSITHIINPYISENEQDNSIQEITFASIDRAIEFSKNEIDVNVIAAIFPEDESVVPKSYLKLELNESTKSIAGLEKEKKLPLLSEIIEIALINSNSDYIVYSNIDIGVMPQFYFAIQEFINEGYESSIINRRRVPQKYNNSNQLNSIYSEVGELHNGFDCFVFPRKLIENFKLGSVCLGIPHVGNSLALNLMSFSNTFKLFTDKHLTFHIGYDLVKQWGSPQLREHNKKEYLKNIKQLKNKLELRNIPGASYPFFKRHFVWLMNPNLHYPTLLKIDIDQWSGKRYLSVGKKCRGYYEWLQKRVKLDN